MKNKYFIYGVAGAGKSWISLHLKRELNLPLVSGDYIRSIAQLDADYNTHPELFYGNDRQATNPIQDILNVRELVKPHFINELQFYNDGVIFEGTCLDPHLTRTLGKTILLVTEDEDKHHDQYFQHRKENEKSLAKFKSKRVKQDFLILEAKELGISIIDNIGHIDQLIKQLTLTE